MNVILCVFRSRADSNAANPNLAVLNEELQSKISENEALHTQLSQIKRDTDTSIMKVSHSMTSHHRGILPYPPEGIRRGYLLME